VVHERAADAEQVRRFLDGVQQAALDASPCWLAGHDAGSFLDVLESVSASKPFYGGMLFLALYSLAIVSCAKLFSRDSMARDQYVIPARCS
jgi:hypothetical protein